MATLNRRILSIAAGALVLVLAQLGPTPASANPGSILMYGPSIDGGTPNEQTVAVAQGHTVTVVTDTEWAAMTTAQFAAYDALVIGDDGCNGDETELDAALANRTTWSPAVTGHITLNTFDPFAHTDEDQHDELVGNSINFAASDPRGTGLYFSLGCWFQGDGDSLPLTLMDQFGTFTIDDVGGDEVTILQPGHPVMSGLTSGGLSDWSNSVHEHFLSFPSSFQALAEETEAVDPAQAVALAFTAPPPICRGQPATMFGGPTDDVLTGTPGKDVIAGLEGNDQIQGAGGKDLICGGLGNDRLKGGARNDTLLGQGGKDRLRGAGGNDTLKGGKGRDRCNGGPGTDKGNCEVERSMS